MQVVRTAEVRQSSSVCDSEKKQYGLAPGKWQTISSVIRCHEYVCNPNAQQNTET